MEKFESTENKQLKRIRDLEAELEKTQRELAQGQEKISLILASVPVAILLISGEGKIEVANKVASNIFHNSRQQMSGLNITDLLPDLAFSKGAVESREMFARRSDGSDFPVEVSIQYVPALKDNRFFVFVSDITDRHKLEQLQKQFVAMLGHDLKAPLSNLSGVLELTLMGAFGELSQDGNKQFQKADKSLNRLIEMISQLLDLERLEAGQMPIEWNPHNLTFTIKDAIATVEVMAQKKDISINFDKEERIELSFDNEKIHRVLTNLLSNAIKFSPNESQIIVELTLNNEEARVCVIDEGSGIQGKDRQSVFSRYKQLNNTDVNSKGSGLGLSICKNIVEAHGGTIGVDDNSKGTGSSFWFKIPLHKDRTSSDS